MNKKRQKINPPIPPEKIPPKIKLTKKAKQKNKN